MGSTRTPNRGWTPWCKRPRWAILVSAEFAAYEGANTDDDDDETIQLRRRPADHHPARLAHRPARGDRSPDRRSPDGADLPDPRGGPEHGRVLVQRPDRARDGAGQAHRGLRGAAAVPD